VGILWDNGQDYQTYFGLNPSYVHGIQWLPISPGSTYLAQDPVFCQQQFNNLLSEQLASTGNNSISSMGSQWGNYALWYALQFNPDYVAAQMDQLFAANDPVATDPIYAGSTYYFTHAYRSMGSLQRQFHTDVPTSAVYYNTNTAQFSYVAYNPLNTPQVATVYSNNIAIGSLLVPAYTLLSSHAMDTTNIIGGALHTNVVSSEVLAGVGLSWPTLALANYTVQWTTDLGSNPGWSTLAGPIVGDGTTNMLFQPFGAATRSFYRIRQEP
jgi:hypothetical protein